jgi:hypothetical protein
VYLDGPGHKVQPFFFGVFSRYYQGYQTFASLPSTPAHLDNPKILS